LPESAAKTAALLPETAAKTAALLPESAAKTAALLPETAAKTAALLPETAAKTAALFFETAAVLAAPSAAVLAALKRQETKDSKDTTTTTEDYEEYARENESVIVKEKKAEVSKTKIVLEKKNGLVFPSTLHVSDYLKSEFIKQPVPASQKAVVCGRVETPGYIKQPSPVSQKALTGYVSESHDCIKQPGLIFPSSMTPMECQAAAGILTRCNGHAQEVLDVVEASIRAKQVKKSPLALLGGIVKKTLTGEFDPLPGLHIALERSKSLTTAQKEKSNGKINGPDVLRELEALRSAQQARQGRQ
jgi:hypothetical protein